MEDYKIVTRESYNKNAKVFSEYFKDLLDLEKRKEFKTFIGLLRGNKILDLGCGSGDHALYFKENGFDVTCIDISENMIELCKQKGLNAEVMDIESLKFEDSEFDGIWAVTSLLHVPKNKIADVVRSLSRVLKDKGILYVCVKEGEGERYIPDKHDLTTSRFFAYWQKEELIDVFKKSFDLVDFWKHRPLNTMFLHFLFRKR